MSVLQCRSLTKNYGSKPAIKGINLDLPEGKIIGLLGPNGSGKTTLIKLIAGILTIDGGEILVDGQPVSTATNAIVSYLPERTYLNDSMTVMELIKFFEDFYTDFDRAKAMDMLARLNIEVTQRIKTMSKGTKEKVQLIMVMSRNAKLYLLDEPIGGVDPAARDYILNTIIGNYAPGATVIISTHLIQDVEKVLDEVIFINQGNIVLQSSVDDIREKEGKSVDTLFREEFRC
ncbi:MAG: ABC transporter ATP-binding protein [Oscillospiraceae bacterium]